MIISWVLTLLYGAAFACGAIAIITGRVTIGEARHRYDAIGEKRRAAWNITWNGIFLKPLRNMLLQGGLLSLVFIVAIAVLFEDLSHTQSVVAGLLAVAGLLVHFGLMAFRFWRGERLHRKVFKQMSLRTTRRCTFAMLILVSAGALLDRMLS